MEKIYTSSLQFDERKNQSFSFYHFVLFDRHDRDRYKANDALQNKSFNVFLKIDVTEKLHGIYVDLINI